MKYIRQSIQVFRYYNKKEKVFYTAFLTTEICFAFAAFMVFIIDGYDIWTVKFAYLMSGSLLSAMMALSVCVRVRTRILRNHGYDEF